jgi:hypothetical protein
MTKTLIALVAAATLATATSAVPTTAQERCVGCGIGGPLPNRAPRLCVLSRLLGTAARGELLLVPHPGLRRLRQHGWLARASRGVLLMVIRLSPVATALN